ncbi:MAG: hypothetical protein HWQ43_26580 [Nostoc sp. JL31]|uniref:hypothetical protein n=1 Tax=Nostoc sp. JL31 TaxID=2815395 RepID=UPI0025E2BB6D|nr:hypothetical protein [Nostoc sp. JL31]MBN3892556.1 hypothetical protein [Nostoc sp. JL31]
MGLQRPKAQKAIAEGGASPIVTYAQIYFSLEELDKADGDVMFVGTLTDDGKNLWACSQSCVVAVLSDEKLTYLF